MYQTVGIKVVTPPFDVNTRVSSLSGPIDEPDLVESIALDLLGEFDDEPVRKLGVRVSNLSFGPQEQVRLDGFDAARATDGESDGDKSDDADGDDDEGDNWTTTTDIAREAIETDAQLTDWVDDESDRADSASDTDSADDSVSEGQSSLGRYD